MKTFDKVIKADIIKLTKEKEKNKKQTKKEGKYEISFYRCWYDGIINEYACK